MNTSIRDIIFMVSSIAVIIGAALPLFLIHFSCTPYIYAGGALGMALCRFSYRYKGKNFRLKRLHHIEVFSALFLLASAFFMFKDNHDWIMFLMVSALLQLYTSIIVPREEKKEAEKEKGKK